MICSQVWWIRKGRITWGFGVTDVHNFRFYSATCVGSKWVAAIIPDGLFVWLANHENRGTGGSPTRFTFLNEFTLAESRTRNLALRDVDMSSNLSLTSSSGDDGYIFWPKIAAAVCKLLLATQSFFILFYIAHPPGNRMKPTNTFPEPLSLNTYERYAKAIFNAKSAKINYPNHAQMPYVFLTLYSKT